MSIHTPEFKALMDAAIIVLEAKNDAYTLKEFPTLFGTEMHTHYGYELGRKYARVFKYVGNMEIRSVWGFVDETGTIWEADGWKAPRKNFARGNISDVSKCGVYSVSSPQC